MSGLLSAATARPHCHPSWVRFQLTAKYFPLRECWNEWYGLWGDYMTDMVEEQYRSFPKVFTPIFAPRINTPITKKVLTGG